VATAAAGGRFKLHSVAASSSRASPDGILDSGFLMNSTDPSSTSVQTADRESPGRATPEPGGGCANAEQNGSALDGDDASTQDGGEGSAQSGASPFESVNVVAAVAGIEYVRQVRSRPGVAWGQQTQLPE
jgi:hypothetical protein